MKLTPQGKRDACNLNADTTSPKFQKWLALKGV